MAKKTNPNHFNIRASIKQGYKKFIKYEDFIKDFLEMDFNSQSEELSCK